MTQLEEEQAETAFARLQAMLQLPQWATAVLVSVSQPSA
jgi:hypothetical protein